MTPHRDECVGACSAPWNECHAVPEDYNGTGMSGFEAARNYVLNAWLASNHHYVIETQTWTNTTTILQACGTDWEPANSDGLVYLIGLKPPPPN